ncbi:histidine phosphatase family protein [Myceligenerans pegani]|uniref:Histidine phosphatase family protein n=1 Tax=Myceligenerans pegani TaxID=2776917 RepID=A0ABR9N5S4_9MICO|nr:histidine phosphatase family protein [Myceligenerans sp. TRM 65318]MBE1878484.1 histidine phosphatase family protein [Myceligenerans sp. TRM 65318]MBE3020755.1 histidine phosphatase family protein [Myceligenerans sp. TRM 65318]
MVLYLVRHGRPLLDPAVPASTWLLDPDHEREVMDLAARAPWPQDAVWFASPEPKAARTAFLLAGREVPVVADLREHDRGGTTWLPDFTDVVRHTFAEPYPVARSGWESIAQTRSRVVAAVGRIMAEHSGRDVVLVGHGTAWTLLAAELTGTEPDLERWQAMTMPDTIVVEKTTLLQPDRDAPAEVWREHLWDRLAVAARCHEMWAVELVARLREDLLVGGLFPVFSHSVLHLRTRPIRDPEARLVAMASSMPGGRFAALVPADGQVFGAWGEYFPWPQYQGVEATVEALREGLGTRETREPVVNEWTLHDNGQPVARFIVTGIAPSGGLFGRLDVEGSHLLAGAIAAARAVPVERADLADTPETWTPVDPTALTSLTLLAMNVRTRSECTAV